MAIRARQCIGPAAGRPVGWTVKGDAWLAVAAALLAPLARTFRSNANDTSRGQQLTWVAHPGRFSSLSEADRGTVARPAGVGGGCGVLVYVPYSRGKPHIGHV